VSLAEVAAAAGASVAHLQRSFRAAYGLGVVEYLQGLRLRRAQELLRSSDMPVEAVAAAVGFASASYFSRLFARELGVSPARFRRPLPLTPAAGVAPPLPCKGKGEGG
jgi:AraC family transcriptional regulator